MTDRQPGRRPFCWTRLAALAIAPAFWLLDVRASAAETTPNALRFGAVRVGALAEGSLRVFVDPADADGPPPRIDAPAFLRVVDVKVGRQQYGNAVKGYCDIWVSLDTRVAGEYSGDLRIAIGRQQVAVPVGATVRPQMPRLTRLLVVTTPFTRYSTSDATLFNPWLDLVAGAPLDVHYLDARPGPVLARVNLKNFDLVLLGMNGLIDLTDSDVKLLRAFMERGGRTIVSASVSFVGTTEGANKLLVPYGLRMIDIDPRSPRRSSSVPPRSSATR